MIILLHSSKTMRAVGKEGNSLRRPALLGRAEKIDQYLKTLSPAQLKKIMHISAPLAEKTHHLISQWSAKPGEQSLALDSFVGDIYRGFRASELSSADRDYADKHLYILSGLYGCVRPYDGIRPYRLEMAYKLPAEQFNNLYRYWGESIADNLPAGPIVNVSSVEYSKTITPFVEPSRVIAPEFLTIDPKTGQPTFFAVHAKVARGAFARWMIQKRIETVGDLQKFDDLNYRFEPRLSTANKPTFVCKTFGGLGLTV
ncbi:MAG: YaaA family protein [Candidatus Saccharimonadales bacterium]